MNAQIVNVTAPPGPGIGVPEFIADWNDGVEAYKTCVAANRAGFQAPESLSQKAWDWLGDTVRVWCALTWPPTRSG